MGLQLLRYLLFHVLKQWQPHLVQLPGAPLDVLPPSGRAERQTYEVIHLSLLFLVPWLHHTLPLMRACTWPASEALFSSWASM